LREKDGKLGLSVLFHGALQRVLMPTGGLDHLCNLGFGDFIREDSTHPDAILMYMQHNSCRTLARFVEKAFKDIDHEFHGRVVVVENQHTVHGRLLGLGLRLGDDGRTRADSLISLLLLRHDGSPTRKANRPPMRLDMKTRPHWKARFKTRVLLPALPGWQAAPAWWPWGDG